ncbi:MAG: PHP domain-containing protein [Dehalococcoidia bacterium]|nr:PHP domain-containing protein [Dehalococcoidia bacterium]
MIIDLHIHTSTGSDGALPVEEVLREAKKRKIGFLSITDHDSLDAQEKASALAQELGITYVTGIELNITFQPPQNKTGSLDFLGYGFNIKNPALKDKLRVMRTHREWRAREILERVNAEFTREGIPLLTDGDMQRIRETVDGAFGRPHIAGYLVKKSIVRSLQEAFDKYLVKCDVPKYPLTLPEASELIRNAGGILVLAHPNDPHGTSLVSMSRDVTEQGKIITGNMLEHIDGIECWHARHESLTAAFFQELADRHGLKITGGSDCHQKPVVMGTVDVPHAVAEQF